MSTLSRETRLAYAVILLLALFSTLYNALLPLHGDEAYYWVWSHHLQSGYYDHAPLIAYCIALSNLISEAEWGVRLVNVACMSLSALFIFKLASRIESERTGLKAVAVFASVLIVHAGYTVTTPDSPLILFWTLSLYYTYRALFENATRFFILTGLFLGLAMLSKYTAILLASSIVIFVLAKRRDLLGDWRLYAAVVIASLVVSPMLWWNYQNDWISFTFQLEHGGAGASELNVGSFFEFLGGQFVVFTPVFAGMLFYYLMKRGAFFDDAPLFLVAAATAFPILFFLYKGLYTTMGLNYAAPAYIGGSVLVAYVAERYGLERWFKAGLVTALLLSLVARVGMLYYLEIFQDRMYGNKEAVAMLETHYRNGDAVYGSHLTVAALLSYYLPGHPDAQIPTKTRMSQYDLWRDGRPWGNGLYLSAYKPRLEELQALFEEVELLDSLTVKRGVDGLKTYYLYRVGLAK